VIPRVDGTAPGPIPTVERALAEGAQAASANPPAPRAMEGAPVPVEAERNLQLAAVLAAVAEYPPVGAGSPASVPVAALLALAAERLGEAERAFLARLLQAIVPVATGDDGGAAIRERLEAGGTILEAKLRQLLEQQPALDSTQLLRRVGPDVRVVLGTLLERFAAARPAGDPGAGGDLHVATEPTSPAAQGLAQADGVAGRILAQQLGLAYRWVTEGVLQFDVAVRLPGEETRATVQFQREGDAGAAPVRAGACSISVHVDSAALGAIEARARWQGPSCQAVCYVSTDEAQTALGGQAASLQSALAAVFPRTNVEVVLDPARAARQPSGFPPDPLPGGSLVSVRA
jgi:hypothetical protein